MTLENMEDSRYHVLWIPNFRFYFVMWSIVEVAFLLHVTQLPYKCTAVTCVLVSTLDISEQNQSWKAQPLLLWQPCRRENGVSFAIEDLHT